MTVHENLVRSGLVAEETLRHRFGSTWAAVSEDTLCEWLLKENRATLWQLTLLKQGKTTGFFLPADTARFRICRPLGTGAMSYVYLAMDTHHDDRPVAIKVLPKKFASQPRYLVRFYIEAATHSLFTAENSHDNIVSWITSDMDTSCSPIRDTTSSAQDNHYFVTEYIQGETLQARVENRGPMTVADAVTFWEQSQRALRHVHSLCVIHRDVKPSNFLVSSAEPDSSTESNGLRVKLFDFGLALLPAHHPLSAVEVGLGAEHHVVGTADYISPEQITSGRNITEQADWYSLGMTFYFCLTGSPPFPTGTIQERLDSHCKGKPKDLREYRSDIPEWLLAEWRQMTKI